MRAIHGDVFRSNAVKEAGRLLGRAEALLNRCQISEAQSLLARATALAPGVPVVQARTLSAQTHIERQRGNYEDAIDCAKLALALWRDLEDYTAELQLRIEIGRVLLSAGNIRDALKEGLDVLNHVDRIVDEKSHRETRVAAWRLLAYVYLNLEQFDQTILFGERAIAGARVDGNVILEGAVFDCIACAYGTMAYQKTAANEGDLAARYLERSIDDSRRAMRLARQGGHRHNEATALANVAEGLVQGGRPDEALALMETWSIDPINDLPHLISHHLDTQGTICMALGRYEEAIVFFSRAMESSRQSNLAVVACEHLADAYERTGDLRSALTFCKRLLTLSRAAMSDAAQRSASTAAVYLETKEASALVDYHRAVAERLQQSNERLVRHAGDLETLSRRDPLTGLANRRAMEKVLAGDCRAMGIIMIDVDHFKAINDEYSHGVGDAVLKQISALIERCCRIGDTPVRYGGDEFTVLLKQTDEMQTLEVAERIRASINDFAWTAIEPELKVSVSVGFSVGIGSESAAMLMAAADRNLYEAKQSGRNRIGREIALQ